MTPSIVVDRSLEEMFCFVQSFLAHVAALDPQSMRDLKGCGQESFTQRRTFPSQPLRCNKLRAASGVVDSLHEWVPKFPSLLHDAASLRSSIAPTSTAESLEYEFVGPLCLET